MILNSDYLAMKSVHFSIKYILPKTCGISFRKKYSRMLSNSECISLHAGGRVWFWYLCLQHALTLLIALKSPSPSPIPSIVGYQSIRPSEALCDAPALPPLKVDEEEAVDPEALLWLWTCPCPTWVSLLARPRPRPRPLPRDRPLCLPDPGRRGGRWAGRARCPKRLYIFTRGDTVRAGHHTPIQVPRVRH